MDDQQIVGKVVQNSPFKSFQTHGCTQAKGPAGRFYPCADGTWWWGKTHCNGFRDQALCSLFQTGLCEQTYGIKPLEEGFIPESNLIERPFPAEGQCKFNASQFSTLATIDAWIANNGKDETYNEIIMPSFCSGSSTRCPEGPDGTPYKSCNRILALGREGQLCSEWANTNLEGGDNAIKNYCNSADNTTSPQCSCALRTQNNLYTSLKTGNPICDGCWYIPCLDSNSRLIPSDVRNNCSAVTGKSACPSQFCESVINNIRNTGSNLDLNKVRQVVNCDLSSLNKNIKPPPNADSKNPIPKQGKTPKIERNATTGTAAFFEKYGWWILAILGVIGILIVIAFLVEKHSRVNPRQKYVVHHNYGEHAPNSYARHSVANYHTATGVMPGATHRVGPAAGVPTSRP